MREFHISRHRTDCKTLKSTRSHPIAITILRLRCDNMFYVLHDFTTPFIINLFANLVKANIEIPLIYRVGWKEKAFSILLHKRKLHKNHVGLFKDLFAKKRKLL
jgi:hypothetical protein